MKKTIIILALISLVNVLLSCDNEEKYMEDGSSGGKLFVKLKP